MATTIDLDFDFCVSDAIEDPQKFFAILNQASADGSINISGSQSEIHVVKLPYFGEPVYPYVPNEDLRFMNFAKLNNVLFSGIEKILDEHLHNRYTAGPLYLINNHGIYDVPPFHSPSLVWLPQTNMMLKFDSASRWEGRWVTTHQYLVYIPLTPSHPNFHTHPTPRKEDQRPLETQNEKGLEQPEHTSESPAEHRAQVSDPKM